MVDRVVLHEMMAYVEVTPQQVFDHLSEKAVFQHRFGLNTCIYVPWQDVTPYLHHFEADKYRSRKYRFGGPFLHLHIAHTPDGYANVHWDHGNPNRNILVGGLVHAVSDCIVFPLLCLWQLGRWEPNPTLEEVRRIAGRMI